jgi:hypothetical protein
VCSKRPTLALPSSPPRGATWLCSKRPSLALPSSPPRGATWQDVLGFVAGSAVNDALILFAPSLDAAPTWEVIGKNCSLSVGLFVFSIGTIITLGGTGKTDGSDREKVERLFIGNSFGFCTGWTWYITVRCAITFVGEFLESYLDEHPFMPRQAVRPR